MEGGGCQNSRGYGRSVVVFLVGLGTRGGCSEGNIYRMTGFPVKASKL